MENQPQPERIKDEMVVKMEFTLLVDGKEFDSSRNSGPIQFIQGFGNIISGLEKELYGMSVGDKKHIKVLAAEAYGTYDPESVVEVPKGDLPPEIPLTPGIEIEVENQDGEMYTAILSTVLDDKVTLDFNHPLAGKDLVFDIKIVDLRPATHAELDHGHAHED